MDALAGGLGPGTPPAATVGPMDRDTAVRLGQETIKASNRRLVEAVLTRRAERERGTGTASPATQLPLIAVTCATGWECYAIAEELVQTRRFRVLTRRSDKRFPLLSTELDRHVATAILRDDDPLVVDLDAPELVLGLEVRAERTWLFARRYPGAGGLPVGTLGRALCLISGGIDSPVAAWMTMKRGCEVSFVTFHSAPYIGEGARR